MLRSPQFAEKPSSVLDTTMKPAIGPETQATQYLRQHCVAYSSHLYNYEEHGGTNVSARELDVDEHVVVKTLIMEDELSKPLIVLMHGDCKVSTKELARQVGCKKIEPCKPDVANRHTGFLVGGTSPFGTKKKMRVFVERTIFDLPLIYINGGRRGYLISIQPEELNRLLDLRIVEVALR
jgi:Cys-tRNA(Pro) deacylase